jgi:hypothetical protein
MRDGSPGPTGHADLTTPQKPLSPFLPMLEKMPAGLQEKRPNYPKNIPAESVAFCVLEPGVVPDIQTSPYIRLSSVSMALGLRQRCK